MSVLAKVMETLVNEQLKDFLATNNTLSYFQSNQVFVIDPAQLQQP